MVVIAFTGRRGSGKSTAAQALVDMGYVDLKFADPLKNMLRAFYATCKLTPQEIERKLEGDLKEVSCDWLSGKTPRHAMQTLGTEWRDLIATDLWSALFIKRVRSGEFGERIVCSDYRFPHEAAALKELGATLYRIERPNPLDDDASKHISESGVDNLPVDYVIHNVGTAEQLTEAVQFLANGDEFAEGFHRMINKTWK